MRKISVLAFICFSVICAEAKDKVQIVIETEILNPDPFEGLKSRQVIGVYFDTQEVKDAYETGVTDFFGVDLTSIRDNFKVAGVAFSNNKSTFSVSGETASGAHLVPNINYKFDFKVDDNGKVEFSGCHDGYPAYRIIVDGKVEYLHKHKPVNLIALFGECDIKVSH